MIPELAELVKSSIEQTLEDKIAVAFSGGLDSGLIAHIAKKHAQVNLFTVGIETSQDMVYAEKSAAEMKLPLHKLIFEEAEILDLYSKCYEIVPGDLLKTELLVPAYKIAEACKHGNDVLLFGSGAEELFVGYERYYTYLDERKDLRELLRVEFAALQHREVLWITKVCRKFGVEARFPFYNRRLFEFVSELPLDLRIADRELKKGLLRDAAKFLGLPKIMVERKKKALQYGSGIHNILLKHSHELIGSKPQ